MLKFVAFVVNLQNIFAILEIIDGIADIRYFPRFNWSEYSSPLIPVIRSYSNLQSMNMDISMILNSDGMLEMANGIDIEEKIVSTQWRQSYLDMGWYSLSNEVHEISSVSDRLKMYLAGYLEGYASGPLIQRFKKMLKSELNRDSNCIKLFFHSKMEHLYDDLLHADNIDPSKLFGVDQQFSLIQLWGLNDGLNSRISDENVRETSQNDFRREEVANIQLLNEHPDYFSLVDLLLLNADGEIDEIARAAHCPLDNITPSGLFPNSNTILPSFTQGKGKRGGASAVLSSDRVGLNRRDSQEAQDDSWAHAVRKFGRCSALVRTLFDRNSSSGDSPTDEEQSGDLCTATPNAQKSKTTSSRIIKDVLLGHTTWSPFAEVPYRILKFYKHPIKLPSVTLPNGVVLPEVIASDIRMSSFAGCIASTDDFMQTSSKLAITETTLIIPSDIEFAKHGMPSPYTFSRDALGLGVPSFIASPLAARRAQTAEEWQLIFSNVASPSYSSQWMTVDFNKVESSVGKTSFPSNTFVVLETSPKFSTPPLNGLPRVVMKDATSALVGPMGGFERQPLSNPNPFYVQREDTFREASCSLEETGLWWSANLPWFSETRDALGYTSGRVDCPTLSSNNIMDLDETIDQENCILIDESFSQTSRDQSPRALLMRAYGSKVESIEDFRSVIRRVEPLVDSKCRDKYYISAAIGDPRFAIAARYDLNLRNVIYDGAIDAKVVSLDMMREGVIEAVNGPSSPQIKNENSDVFIEGVKVTGLPWVRFKLTATKIVNLASIESPQSFASCMD